MESPCLKSAADSGSRPYSIHLVSAGEKRGRPRDQSRWKPWPRRSTSWTSITSVAAAILVNAPTLGGWYLLQRQAVVIPCTTGLDALLFSGLSRRDGESGEIGVARIECSRTDRQKHCKKYGDDENRTLATFHGPAPIGLKNSASLA